MSHLNERLPLPGLKDIDDSAAIFIRGMNKYRRRYDRDGTWIGLTEDFIHYKPETEVPKLASDVASIAPDGSIAASPTTVQQLFNILAFSEASDHQYAKIPYTPLGNSGKV